MNKRELMVKYAKRKTLYNDELEYLDDCLLVLINETRLSDAL